VFVLGGETSREENVHGLECVCRRRVVRWCSLHTADDRNGDGVRVMCELMMRRRLRDAWRPEILVALDLGDKGTSGTDGKLQAIYIRNTT